MVVAGPSGGSAAQTTPWWGSSAFWGAVVAILAGAGSLLAYIVQVIQGAAPLDAAQLQTLLAGLLQAGVGLALMVWRLRKGLDPARPEPRITLRAHWATAALSMLLALLLSLVACNPWVVRTSCVEGAQPVAAIVDPPDGLPGASVEVRCGDEVMQRLHCDAGAELHCGPDPAIECRWTDGGAAEVRIDDPDGVLCGDGGGR